MTRDRFRVPVLAVCLAVAGVVIALLLPLYTCADGYRFERIDAPGGGPSCFISDMGYRPRSWVPTKITFAAGGIVAALGVVLWARRQRLVAAGLVLAFVAIAAPWFVPNGFEQTIRDGRPVCCGREIDRGAVRAGIVIAGTSIGAALTIADVVRSRRREAGRPELGR